MFWDSLSFGTPSKILKLIFFLHRWYDDGEYVVYVFYGIKYLVAMVTNAMDRCLKACDPFPKFLTGF